MTTITDHIPTIEAPEEGAPAAAPERFIIDTEDKALWALERIMRERESLARLDAQYAAMRAAQVAELERTEARFLLPLEDWAKANPPKKGKTIKTLAGDLAFRTVNGGWRVTDKAAALEWAKAERPELVKVKTTEELDTDAAKALAAAIAKESGEVLPGLEFFEDRESFSVKAAKPGKGDE